MTRQNQTAAPALSLPKDSGSPGVINMNPLSPLMQTSRIFRPASALLLACLLPFAAECASAAGIPEPSLTLYGRVLNKFNGATTRVTQGQLSWTFKPLAGGAWVTATTRLTNINDQFSFVLQVPCESEIAGVTLSPNTLKVPTVPAQLDRSSVLVNTQAVIFALPAQTVLTLAANERGHLEQVDLLTALAPVDSDGDGLPDDWELAHFGSLAHTGQADNDGDGVSNLDEFRAGTDPNDPQSCFALISVEQHPQGGMQVTWSSAADRTYVLQRSSNLLDGFTDVATGQSATPPTNVFRDATATGAGPYFYRLRIAP